MKKPKIAILVTSGMKRDCISTEDFQRLNSFAEIIDHNLTRIDEEKMVKLIEDVEGCLTGWGTPSFSREMIDAAPNLKIIAHSAGSVKMMLGKVVEEIKKRNITVTTAAPSIAIGVAEFTLGMMLMTMKRVWWFKELTKQGRWREEEKRKKVIETYKSTIGIIGAGYVGRYLIKLLKQFEVKILVYDPYLSNEEAVNMGVEKVSLETLMASSDVVSLHAPATEETKKLINKKNLRLMKDGAVFINTARGAIVNEEDLIEELKTGRITACLDVTDPEPPSSDSPLRRLPNVILTPHMAGAVANNRFRQGRYAVDELERFFKGEKVLYQVNLNLWNQIA